MVQNEKLCIFAVGKIKKKKLIELAVEETTTILLTNRLKGKSLDEVVNNGWNRLSELYDVDMRQLAAKHNLTYN